MNKTCTEFETQELWNRWESPCQSSHLCLGDFYVWEIIKKDCGKWIFSEISDLSEIQVGKERGLNVKL